MPSERSVSKSVDSTIHPWNVSDADVEIARKSEAAELPEQRDGPQEARRGKGKEGDTDVDWRPRVPQWPAIGDTMATAIQSALSGQATVKAALDDAQRRIEPMMRG